MFKSTFLSLSMAVMLAIPSHGYLPYTYSPDSVKTSNSGENGAPEGFYEGKATAYCVSGTMASGKQTRYGVCASSKDRIGAVIILYQKLPDGSLGKYIGTYECLDTGGAGVSSGNVIDVWKPNLSECQDFMDILYLDGCKGNVYYQVVYGEG